MKWTDMTSYLFLGTPTLSVLRQVSLQPESYTAITHWWSEADSPEAY